MKHLIFFFWLFFGVLLHKDATAQTLFVPSAFNTAADEEAFGVAELPNNQFVFTAKTAGLTKQSGNAFIFITDKSGSVLRSKTLLYENADTSYFSNAVFWNADNSISVFGFYYNKTSSSLRGSFCIRVDTNLNILSNKRVHLNTGLGISATKTIQSGTNTYSIISFLDNVSTPRLRITKLIKFNPSGDTLATRNIDSSFFGFHKYYSSVPMGLSNGVNTGHFYLTDCYILSDTAITVYSPFDAGRFGVIKIDTNLQLLDSLQLNYTGSSVDADTLFGYNREVAACSENNIIIGPFIRVMNVDIFKSYDGYGIAKYDLENRNVIKSTAILYDKSKGTSTVNAQMNSMATRYDKVFGLGCYDCGTARSTSNSYFGVSCYDTNANLKWHHYYGGDAYYNASNIYACKDGGVMVMAVRYDHNTDNQRDFYIFKLDSASGNPTSIVNISSQLREAIAIFPNPAHNELHIKGASDGDVFIIYDGLGKQLIVQTLHANENTINIEAHPAAHYMYQIKSKQGAVIQNGKWVKN